MEHSSSSRATGEMSIVHYFHTHSQHHNKKRDRIKLNYENLKYQCVSLCDITLAGMFSFCTEGHVLNSVRSVSLPQDASAGWILNYSNLILFTVKFCPRIQSVQRFGGSRNRYLGALMLQAHYKSSVSSPDLYPVSSCRRNLRLKTLVTGKKGEVTHSACQSVFVLDIT